MVAKSCTTWDGREPINNGMFTISQLVQDFATIHRTCMYVLELLEDVYCGVYIVCLLSVRHGILC